VLSAEPVDEPPELSREELAAGVERIFIEHEARYLLAAASEPARYVGWVMAFLNDQRATFMREADREAPILGTADARQEQWIMRVVASKRFVVLVDMTMEKQMSEIVVSGEELASALREADLPVWHYLLEE
jgi:hypothetical protein